ncbi:MAG: hypothetical protein L0Z62_37100 [Gemmataceae bacterium]|nr:hypothetical protein [Gemmataceae bacterium]
MGFDCDTLDEQNHRVCAFAPTDTRIVLHDYPHDQPVREEILIGVRLQLDNGGVMSRAEFDRWATRRAEANTGADRNGGAPRRKTRKGVSPPR